MACGGSPEWKEWVPLNPLLDQLPQQFQRGFATSDLQLTCLASLPQHLVLGTNVGLVYLAHLPSLNLMRLKCENPLPPITCVSGVSTVDDMIAAGALDGTITIFQLPRVANVPGSMSSPGAVAIGTKGLSPAQPTVKRFTVGTIHSARVTYLTWSRNGMRLFSGDTQGVVSVIDINYQTNECTAKELLKEESSITQLSYSYQKLAVSTLERALIYNVADGNIQQVGMKPRKHPGLFGCVWSPTVSNVDAVLYTSRPGLRLWSANTQGEVMHTHIIKELPDVANMQLINPGHEKPREGERFSFGILFTLGTSHIVTYNPNWLFVIDIDNLKVASYSGQFRHISGVAVSEKEIFVLEGSRNISCISLEKPNIGDRRKPLPPKPSIFPDPQNLLGIKAKIMTQGSGLLDQIARVGSTVAAKVQEHASPPVVTGHNEKNSTPTSANGSQQQLGGDRQFFFASDSLNISSSRQELGHQRSSSSGTIQEPPQRSYSPSMIPPRMVQSVSSFFPSIISSQSLVKTFGKTPTFMDMPVPGECEVIGDLEEIVTSSQIVAQEGAEAEPLVMRDKAKKKMKRKYDTTPSPDTMSITSCKSTQSDVSDATSSELPSSPLAESASLLFVSPTQDMQTAPTESNSEVTVEIDSENSEPRANSSMGYNLEDENDSGARVERVSNVKGPNKSHKPEFDLQIADNRTYEDFKSNIEQNESLLADILDLNCLKMDHESGTKVENGMDETQGRHSIDRELSFESGGCSTPSTVKEQSPLPEAPVYEDFYSQFYSGNSFTSIDSGESSSKKIRDSTAENNFDDNSFGSNDGGERIESNTSEDRLSCLSYGPPSGSSLVSLPGNRFHTESQENSTNEPRTMITVTDSSEVADISWSYSTVDFQEGQEYENEEMIGGWIKQKVPSSVFSLSVSENTITFLDDCGCLYFKNVSSDSSSQTWKKVKLTAKVTDISLSPNNSLLWIRSDGHAYAVGSPALEAFSPAKMSLAARNVKQMSVDDELAWYIRKEGQVCVQLGLSSRSPSGAEYTVSCKEYQLVKVVCQAKVVWGLTDHGKVVFRIGVSTQLPMGHEWGLMKGPGVHVQDLALGPGQWGWILDEEGRIHFRFGVCAENPQGMDEEWWQVASSDYMMEHTSDLGSAMISVSSKGVYLAERGKNHIYSHSPNVTGHVWRAFSKETWSTVCAEGVYMDQGAICCLSPKGQLFIINPNTANYVPLEVVNTECIVSVAQRPEAIWVLTAAGDIYIRVGLSASSLHGSHWEQLDLHQIGDVHLCHLSCGTEVVWGVDTRGGVYMRQGPLSPPPTESLPPAWIQVDPVSLKGNAVFTKVYVGTKLHMVWALDSCRRVYVREAIFPELPIGLSWVPVIGLSALHLSISENNVYALTPNGEIFKRIGVTETNYIGDTWEKIPGNLAKISVTTDDRLWGLNSSGHLYEHTQLAVAELQQDSARSRDISLSSEAEDWEMI